MKRYARRRRLEQPFQDIIHVGLTHAVDIQRPNNPASHAPARADPRLSTGRHGLEHLHFLPWNTGHENEPGIIQGHHETRRQAHRLSNPGADGDLRLSPVVWGHLHASRRKMVFMERRDGLFSLSLRISTPSPEKLCNNSDRAVVIGRTQPPVTNTASFEPANPSVAAICSGASATTACSITSAPSSTNRWPRKRALLLTTSPRRTSSPIAKTAHESPDRQGSERLDGRDICSVQ